MSEPTLPESIRNIALLGTASAGKTTLAQALLAMAGGRPPTDTEPRQQAPQHSVTTSIAGFDWNRVLINLIDTPGLPDFLGASLSVLPAVETAVIVVDAQAGLDAATRRMMDVAAERRLCRMIVINKLDTEAVDLPALLGEIRSAFGQECLALNLPAGQGNAVADCFFQPSGEADFLSVEQVHSMLVDQVVEVDEELMALYLEQGEELSPEQLHEPFEQAMREGHLVPICFASAKSGVGLAELLEVFVRLMPNPLEGNPPPFIRDDASGRQTFKAVPDPGAHVLAHVVKIENDPFLGKLAAFRIHQGTVTRDSRLFIGDGRKAFKAGNLFRLLGSERIEAERCIPGDICAVAKVEDIHFDAVLHDSHEEDRIHLRPVALPSPVFGLAVRATRHSDEQKFSDVVRKLTEEDPGLQVEHDTTTNETVLRGLGDLHLRVALDHLRERYKLEVETSLPAIAYRETVTAPAEGHYRHKKQTGGAGQFGEVFLRIEPLSRGEGFEFVDQVKGAAIPGALIPAVEKGIRQAMASGAIAGYPLQDVRVTVYDGKTHSVDSKEVAFVIAGRKAFLDAVLKAKPIVLEPIVELDIQAPESAVGDITSDLSSRRGRILDTRSNGVRMKMRTLAPFAELGEFSSKLKSLTSGEGLYSLQFSHYEQAPVNVQQQLVAAYKPSADE
ncbi:MAG: elongation factor G [Acidihalobacter sp.]